MADEHAGADRQGDGARHLTAEAVAAYVDGRLDASSRAGAESHLAACPTCRTEVMEVSALVDRPRTRHSGAPRALWVGALGVAAAAALLIVVVPGARQTDPAAAPVERASSADEAPRVQLVSPSGAQSPAVAPIQFVWHSREGAAYRLTITDATGAVVWSTATADTVATHADPDMLRPGVQYNWFVDAVLPDGSAITSGVTQFTTRRE